MRKHESTVRENGNGNKKKKKEVQEYDARDKYPWVTKDTNSTPKKGNHGQRFTEYAWLNAPRSQILMDIEKDVDLRWLKSLRTDLEKRNKNQFCRFHKEFGHDTNDCRQLKNEIEFQIRKGKLDKFTKDGN